jgi:hypothetical protein
MLNVYMYYSKDATEEKLGENILVYHQILTRENTNSRWDKYGAYQGYAPLRGMNGYVEGNKTTYSIDPKEWIPGAIPVLTE